MTRGERKISVSEGEQSSLKRKGGDQVKHKACEHSNQQPNYCNTNVICMDSGPLLTKYMTVISKSSWKKIKKTQFFGKFRETKMPEHWFV